VTVSEHQYAAWLIGTPDRALTIRAGSITLDDTSAPHVTASLDVALPDAAVLGLLDPRERKRVRVDVTATFPFGVQTRTFNLGIRSREVSHRDAVATLALASDEALLDDYAPLADDRTAYTHQHSVRAVVGSLLAKAIPGAVLAPGGPDAAVRALITSTNLVRNPRAKNDLTDWSSTVTTSRVATGGPPGCPTYVWTAHSAPGTLLVAHSESGVPIQAGKRYRISVWQQADAGVIVGMDGIIYAANNTTLADLTEAPRAAVGSWERRTLEFVAPAGATKIRLRAFTTTSVPAGRSLDTTGWRVSEVTDDGTDIGYFDGDTTDTSEYLYAYADATSTRMPLIDRAPDLLTQRAGVSGFDFLAPILQAFGFRLVCDEGRVWTLRDASYTAPGSLTVRYGVNLVDGDDTITRDDTAFFDAAVVRYSWRDLHGAQQERIDSFALVTPPTQVRVFEKTVPYPGPGFAEYAVRRAQGRGRQVTATTVADWRTAAEQPSQYMLPGAPVQVGNTSRVVFHLDRDEMTVTSRTIDTPPSAWLLIPAGERWIDSPPGASWISEAIS
jgi:hypothetical protein